MGRRYFAIPPEKVGKVPCLWTEGCKNAATHVDELTERTVCPPCYEANLWAHQAKGTVTASAVERALAAATGQAKSALKVFSDQALLAADAVNQPKGNGRTANGKIATKPTRKKAAAPADAK